MNSTDNLWNFIQSRLMEEVRAQRWYNDQPPYGLRGFLNDKANRIIGYPILRQVRNKRFVCEVTTPMDGIIKECSGSNYIENEDTIDYCATWHSLKNSTDDSCRFPEFKYETGTKLQTFTQVGRLSYYGPGGYVIRLQGTRSQILKRLNILQKNQWIDKRTRAVFLEFSVYNANANLFSTCTILMEFSSGGIQTKWMMEPVKLMKVSSNAGDTLIYCCEIMFVVATLIFTLQQLLEMKKQKCSYLTHYWNITEIIIILLSYIEVFFYVYRGTLTSAATQEFARTKGNEYVRIDLAVLIDTYYHYFLSFIMFFSLLKLIKLLQFNKQINSLSLTIKLCWEELSYFFIFFAIIFFSFCALFNMLFMQHLKDYSYFGTSVMSTFKMMLGKFKAHEMTQINSFVPVLYFMFSVSNSMVLVNIMLSIILQAFAVVRDDLQSSRNEILHYFWNTIIKTIRLQPNAVYQVAPDYAHKKNIVETPDENEDDTSSLPTKVKIVKFSYITGFFQLIIEFLI